MGAPSLPRQVIAGSMEWHGPGLTSFLKTEEEQKKNEVQNRPHERSLTRASKLESERVGRERLPGSIVALVAREGGHCVASRTRTWERRGEKGCMKELLRNDKLLEAILWLPVLQGSPTHSPARSCAGVVLCSSPRSMAAILGRGVCTSPTVMMASYRQCFSQLRTRLSIHDLQTIEHASQNTASSPIFSAWRSLRFAEQAYAAAPKAAGT